MAFSPRVDRSLRKVLSQIGTPLSTEFVPDPFQIEARDRVADQDVLVSAPTGSGKTWIAVQAISAVFAQGRRSWYASPLKALSNSKYVEFSDIFGAEFVGILTGDRKENTDAPIVVGTTEILRNQLYDAMAQGVDINADLVVLDEAHYLGDVDRGVVWEEVMIYLPRRVRLLMLSATIPNDRQIAGWLEAIRGHSCAVIHSETRPVPLHPLYLLPAGELVPLTDAHGLHAKIQAGTAPSEDGRRRRVRAPAYENILHVLEKFDLLPAVFFLKSRAECNEALHTCRRRFVAADRQHQLQERLDSLLHDHAFLQDHPQRGFFVHHGLASHHGGQLPNWKIITEKLMQEGLLDAIFSTSTVAAGVNFPARSVVLMQSDRFNGREFTDLTATELHQAIGRAGRRGRDNVGFAVFVHGRHQNPRLIAELMDRPPDPITSRITINFSMCLNLLLSHTPDEVRRLLQDSFATYQSSSSLTGMERHYRRLLTQISPHLQGTGCATAEEMVARTSKRRELTNRLAHLRKRLKQYLKHCAQVSVKTDNDPDIIDWQTKIAQLDSELKNLPCRQCRHAGQCYGRRARQFQRTLREARTLRLNIDQARDMLWNLFQKHVAFLHLTGFAGQGGELTGDGLWASQLRLDQPLIIAELIRAGVLESLDCRLLAAVIAVFVQDKFRELEISAGSDWDRRSLRTAFHTMQAAVADLIALKKKNGFETPVMQFWPAAAIFLWADGKSWDEVQQIVPVDEGDLAMMIYRTADNLRQIATLQTSHPELAAQARRSIELLLREPVVVPT